MDDCCVYCPRVPAVLGVLLLFLQVRPLTHDLMKNMLQEVGFRVTKVGQQQQ